MTFVTFVTLISIIGPYARAGLRLSKKCVTSVTSVTMDSRRFAVCAMPDGLSPGLQGKPEAQRVTASGLRWYDGLYTCVIRRLRFQADAEKFALLSAAIEFKALLVHLVIKALTGAGRMARRKREFLP